MGLEVTRHWSPRERRAIGAVLVVLAVFLAGCTPGTAPPSVCVVCDDRTVDAAAQLGANVTVTDSEVHIHVHADGTARWVVRVGLSGGGVAALRANESLRRTVVEERLRGNRGPAPNQPVNVTTRMDGKTLVVGFTDRGFASREPGGVLLVERFHHETDSTVPAPFRLAADRLVIHAPDGWRVLNDVPGAQQHRRAVVWRKHIDERTYVVLGPDGSATSEVAGQAAVAGAVAGWATVPVLGIAFVPTALLGLVLGVAVSRVDRSSSSNSVDPGDRELLGSMLLTGLVVLVAGTGVVLWHVPASRALGNWLSGTAGPDAESSLGSIVRFFVMVLAPPVIAAYPAGLVAHRRPAVRWPPAVLAVSAIPLEALWLVLVAADNAGLLGIILTVVGILAALPTYGAFDLGRRTARAQGWTAPAGADGRNTQGDEHAGE